MFSHTSNSSHKTVTSMLHAAAFKRHAVQSFGIAVIAGLCAVALTTTAHAASKSSGGHGIGAAHASTAVYVGANRGYRPHYAGRYYNGYRPYYGWRGGYYRAGLYAGLFVPLLPLGYATYWYAGAPYYYHDDVYYVSDRSGYRVIEPPVEAVISAPSTSSTPSPAPVVAAPPVLNGPAPTYVNQPGQLFAYPRNGQTATQATFDRIECERWGTQQTGFQPTVLPVDDAKKSDYQRAVSACLEGRGYTVK